jgi:Tfp pilus assembly PilM family ATPase/Tfp pilus assembly protein PilN
MIYLRTSVGVEIRQDDLLISSLQRNLSGAVFTHFKRIRGYRLRDRAEVRREIDQFFKSNRLGHDEIVLGLPRRDVVVRHLELPPEVADNLKQVVLYQVQSFEPTEEEKFYYDYVPLRMNEGSKKLSVLLVMVKKSILDAHLSVLQELGLRPVTVTLGCAGLSNLFIQGTKGSERKTYILADLSPSDVEVMAVRDGALVYTRESTKPGGASWKDFLIHELELAAAKTRMSPEDAIEKIVLAGEESAAAQRELREDLTDCELISESVAFEIPVENRSHLQEAAVSLGLAHSGLSRRLPTKLNLLPHNLRTRQTPWAYVPAIALGAVVIALLAGLGLHRIFQERIVIRQLDQQIASLRGPVKRVQDLRAETEALEKKIRYVEGIFRQRDMNLEVLRELTTILPPDTFITSYDNPNGNITISGASPSPPDLILKLERSPVLMNVVPQGTVFRDQQTGKDRFSFQMKVER